MRELPDGHLEPLSGVTNTLRIIDKSEPLIRWAVRKCVDAIRSKMGMYLRPDGIYEIYIEEFDSILEGGRKAHSDALDDAADVGHLAHVWIESVLTELLAGNEKRLHELLAKLPVDERAANCCVAAIEWMVRHDVKWIATERKIFSKEFLFAGTLDGLARTSNCDDPMCCPEPFTDILSICDWKSSNSLHNSYCAQANGAYRLAYTEEVGSEFGPEACWIIRLGKDDGEFDPWFLRGEKWYEVCKKMFLDALALNHSVDTVEDGISSVKEVRRAAMKLKAQAAKEAAMKIKCDYADKYKGVRKPNCNKGNPCQTCLAIYAAKHPTPATV